MPCPYPTFDEGEIISLDYEGEDFEEVNGAVFHIDERINAKFQKWDHKKDVPFGHELHVVKDNGEAKAIDEKKIHFVSRINSTTKTEFEPIWEVRRPEFN